MSLSPQLPRHPSCLDTNLSEVSFKWLLVLAADQCQREDFPDIFVVHRPQNSCFLVLHSLLTKESITERFSLTVLLFSYLSLPSHTFWSIFISLSSVSVHLYLCLNFLHVSTYLHMYLPAYLFMSISFYLQYLPTYLPTC